MKVLISGGGTGGHIFPAVSIANAIKKALPDTEFLFIGANGRMEMEKVPAEGYKIIGLPVRGFFRPLWNPKNVCVLWDLFRSVKRAKKIIRDFKPDVAVGVGGYASAAALQAAHELKVPYVLQEQNGFAGVTNQKLADEAEKICVAYPNMERFFPKDRIVMTGNPVRQALLECTATVEEARASFGLDADRPTIFVTGGSLGARSINESIEAGIQELEDAGIQVLWQTGKANGTRWSDAVKSFEGRREKGAFPERDQREQGSLANEQGCHIHTMVFVTDMAKAYRAADVVISRSGAGAVNEICLIGKASILVPLPTAAEDHQTANARALSDKDAAILIPDREARKSLVAEAIALVKDKNRIKKMEENARSLGIPGAADTIAKIVIDVANQKS